MPHQYGSLNNYILCSTNKQQLQSCQPNKISFKAFVSKKKVSIRQSCKIMKNSAFREIKRVKCRERPLGLEESRRTFTRIEACTSINTIHVNKKENKMHTNDERLALSPELKNSSKTKNTLFIRGIKRDASFILLGISLIRECSIPRFFSIPSYFHKHIIQCLYDRKYRYL